MTEAAFFDLDKTIIAKSSTLAFTRPMFRAGLLSGATLAKAGVAQVYYQAFGADHDQLERIKEELANMTRGWSRDEVVALVEETVDQVVAPLVYAEALAIIESHRSAGRRVVVVSASPEEIVRPLCRYLGIGDVIATRSEVDEEGRYTGQIEQYMYGPGKAKAMTAMAKAEGIDLSASYSYSDSATDLPMMEVVGHPVAVNPDSELRAVAEERGWEIREFQSAVTLRDKLASKAVPGAAVATGVAAVLAYWALKGRKGSASG
jgi:HAD superfamily hydrolase (TIGR01490 family)